MRKYLPIVLVVLVPILVTFLFSYLFFTKRATQLMTGTQKSEEMLSRELLKDSLGPSPSPVHIPEPKETPIDIDILVPNTSRAVIGGSLNQLRVFDLRFENGKFSGRKIIVQEGDVVRIRLSGGSEAFDVVVPAFGLRQDIGLGETKTLEFQAGKPGTYVYYCEVCGGSKGGDSPASGLLIVAPKGS